MLYDAGSLIHVTLKHSKQRKGGFIYNTLSSTGSVKEIVDASKCKPFDNNAVAKRAIDPLLRQAARNVAGKHTLAVPH